MTGSSPQPSDRIVAVSRRSSVVGLLGGLRRSGVLWLVAVNIVLFIGLSLATPQLFLSRGNFASMAVQFPGYGILALAMVVPMVSGGIDLSIIAISNLTAILGALTMQGLAGPSPDSSPHVLLIVTLGIGVAVAAGALAGALNGLIIATVGVAPILATLASALIFSGIAIVLTNGTALFGLPADFAQIGDGQVLGIPAPVIVFSVVALALTFILSQTAFGAKVYLLGTNPTAARYAGLDSRRIIYQTYVTSGTSAAIAGLIIAARANSAKADYGSSYLLLAILICVLGGVSPFGGSGRVAGVVLAVLALQMLSSGLNLLGVNNFATELVWGLLLLLTMTANRIRSSK